MSRPEKDVIVAFAIGDASILRGSCFERTEDLMKKARRWSQPPSDMEEVTVSIKMEGDAQNHMAMSAKWPGDTDYIMVDNSIGQFGGDLRVFVGTRQEWKDELRRLLNATSVTEDETGGDFLAAFVQSLPPKQGAFEKERVRRTSSSSSLQTHVADTLQKNASDHAKPGCGGCTLF